MKNRSGLFSLVRMTDSATSVTFSEHSLSGKETDQLFAKLIGLARRVPTGELRLDFRKVSYVNAAAVGVLASLSADVARAGGRVVLANVARHLQELFDNTRVTSLFTTDGDARVPSASVA